MLPPPLKIMCVCVCAYISTVHFVGLSRRNEICDGSHTHTHDEIERHLFQFQEQRTQNDFWKRFSFHSSAATYFILFFSFLLSFDAFEIVLFIVSDVCACVSRLLIYSWHRSQSSFCFAQHERVYARGNPITDEKEMARRKNALSKP